MPFKSGFCGVADHPRCKFMTVNGTRADARYLACSCDCHDGSATALAAMQETIPMRAFEDVPPPLNASRDEVSRYVDTVNALMRPRADSD